MRQYRFAIDEIVCDESGYLSLRHDPKYLYALKNEDLFPIDVNRASFEELVRVPGIGPRSARRILATRRAGYSFKKMSELLRMGVVMKRARGFFSLGNAIQERLPYGC
jgi:predicted DNA-binding helix-hairpin-helix protein